MKGLFISEIQEGELDTTKSYSGMIFESYSYLTVLCNYCKVSN